MENVEKIFKEIDKSLVCDFHNPKNVTMNNMKRFIKSNFKNIFHYFKKDNRVSLEEVIDKSWGTLIIKVGGGYILVHQQEIIVNYDYKDTDEVICCWQLFGRK